MLLKVGLFLVDSAQEWAYTQVILKGGLILRLYSGVGLYSGYTQGWAYTQVILKGGLIAVVRCM